MTFQSRRSYKISRFVALAILALCYVAGIAFLGTESRAVGENVAVLIYAIILTPGTVLVCLGQRWATYTLVFWYFMAFFTFVTPTAACVLLYALATDTPDRNISEPLSDDVPEPPRSS